MRILNIVPLVLSLSLFSAVAEDKQYTLVEQLGFDIATAEARLIGDKEVTSIPVNGVFVQDGRKFALVQSDKDPQVFSKWEVKLGNSDGKFVETVAGVFAGDKVIVKSHSLVGIDSDKLAIVKPKQPAVAKVITKAPVKEAAVVEVKKKAETTTSYGIQIGAFSKADNALRIAEQLKTDFGRTDVLTSESNGKSIYRVRVGEYPTVTVANDSKEKLKAKGFGEAFVVAIK